MKKYIPKDVRWWEKLILFFRSTYTTPWRNGHRLKVKRWRNGWYVVDEERME